MLDLIGCTTSGTRLIDSNFRNKWTSVLLRCITKYNAPRSNCQFLITELFGYITKSIRLQSFKYRNEYLWSLPSKYFSYSTMLLGSKCRNEHYPFVILALIANSAGLQILQIIRKKISFYHVQYFQNRNQMGLSKGKL